MSLARYDAAVDGGIYLVIFQLERSQTITIGRLGRSPFRAGHYLYVGSAQRNMRSRLARHARRRKPLRWHIDYLAARARFVGALMMIGGDKSLECRLAGVLAKHHPRVVPGFGSSDCRCGGHLFRVTSSRGSDGQTAKGGL